MFAPLGIVTGRPGTTGFITSSWTFNSADKAASITLSDSDREADAGTIASTYASVRGTVGYSSGKHLLVFWPGPSGTAPTANQASIGLANATFALTGKYLGQENSVGLFAGSGLVYIGAASVDTVDFWVNNVPVYFAVDKDNDRLWIRTGGYWNADASADPASNVGGIDISAFAGATLYPAVAFADNNAKCRSAEVSLPGVFPPNGFTRPW